MLGYRAKLMVIVSQASPQPASLTGAKTCQRSGVCCWRRPCELFPGDPEKLAAQLGLKVEEVFEQYLVVDEIDGNLVLLPRRGQQTGGRYLTNFETYDIDTPCVFLDQNPNTCRVQEAKPQGGAQWDCTMTANERQNLPKPEWTKEALMSLGWNGHDSIYNEDY